MFVSTQTVPAVVLDAGSRLTKAGFAGADLPQYLFPSAVGCYVGDTISADAAALRSSGSGSVVGYENLLGSADRVRFLEVRSAFDEDGIIHDWAAFEGLLDYTYQRLGVFPEDYALLFVEPSHNPKRPREELCQVLFEKYSVPAVYFGRSAALACISAGRHTGLVLDCGASGVTAAPVLEGNVIKPSVLRSRVAGGSAITRAAAELLGGLEAIQPAYAFRRTALGSGIEGHKAPQRKRSAAELSTAASSNDSSDADDQVDLFRANSSASGSVEEETLEKRAEYHLELLDVRDITRSYADFARLEVAEDFKHHICCVNRELGPVADSSDSEIDPDAAASAPAKENVPDAEPRADPNMPPITYELPDGTQVSVGQERYRPAELLFQSLPHARTVKEDRPFLAYIRERERGPSTSKGIAGMVADAIRRCEGAQHREMFAGVVLTGGSSVLPGLSDRLQTELYFYHSRSRVHAAANPMERKYMAWTGGSILATFVEFQQNWFSRAEYLESGVTLVQKRCP